MRRFASSCPCMLELALGTAGSLPDTFWSAISYGMGCASVLIWLCAQMPQILKNWRRKSVDGLSIVFLLAWVAGDATNLMGCLLTGQLGVQILLASYYCCVDLILGVQFWIYSKKAGVEVIQGLDPANVLQAEHSCDNTNQRPAQKKHRVSMARAREHISTLLTVPALAGSVRRASAAPVGLSIDPASSEAAVDIGFFVAYFSMVMYVTSRWPQIWHNFQRKSTTGVSMMLFMSAFMGNLTYTLSIVLSPQCMGETAHRGEFLLKELPYIVGAAGTMLFDCIILGQWYYYHRVLPRHPRRSTELLDRMARPYMGTLRPAAALDGEDQAHLHHSPRFYRRSSRPDKTPLLLSHQSVYSAQSDRFD